MRTLVPNRNTEIIDWNGNILSKRILKFLDVGCTVRVQVSQNRNTDTLYFKIIKKKDGTFWGKVNEIYPRYNPIDLYHDDTFTFRKENINEVPIIWQPKWFQKKVSFADQLVKRCFVFTGSR
jgi:hypothetical protein